MLSDFKYALRMLVKSPVFTIIAVVTLALGIGANTAIFSVVDTVLLRPLPFPNPDQLAMIWTIIPRSGDELNPHSYPDYVDYREQSRSFGAMAAYTGTTSTLRTDQDSQLLRGLAASADIFRVLEAAPFIGRGYTREEDAPGAPRVVVIGYGLWQRAFGGDRQIVGKQIKLSAEDYTVVGVLPPGWKFPVQGKETGFLLPLARFISPEALQQRGAHYLSVVARLNDGLSVREAHSELQTIAARLAQQYPGSNAGRGAKVISLRNDIVDAARPVLLILLGAVGLVLLIACANVANLLLARAATRQHEIAIRAALGASRTRIVRQLLAECFLLSVLGGSAGMLLGWWGVDLLATFPPKDLPRFEELRINASVTAFTLILAILSTFVFGLAPALQISAFNLQNALQEGAKAATRGVHSQRWRNAFVVIQVAISLVLLAGAGLLIKSFWNLRGTDPGFDASRVQTVSLSLPKIRYRETEQATQFCERLLAMLAVVPGVEAVGAGNPIPFGGGTWTRAFTIVGQPAPPSGQERAAERMNVDGNYFTAMKIPLRVGRTFSSRDGKDAPLVVVINETFARQFFQGVNPLGQELIMGTDPADPNPRREIVGVVGDTRHNALAQPPVPEMYLPFQQQEGTPQYLDVVLRTSAPNPAGLDAMIRNAVHAIDRELYVPKVQPLSKMLSASLAQPRFNMSLVGLFACVAMILAAIGIYGVIAYNVAQRTKEIGIRMALGAQRRDMLQMVLWQSFSLVGIGLLAGLLSALALTRLMTSLLYGITAHDLSIYAIVMIVLSSAALLASYFPARRAMQVDPMVALRYE
jgi:putative ABC transport system permease protein